MLDPQTHQPVPAGQPGVMTVTSLVHEVMPLVRYFTGDVVRIDAASRAAAATPVRPRRCSAASTT